MDYKNTAYSNILVSNLLGVTQTNAQICEYLITIERNDQKFIELENTLRAEVFFYFLHCIHNNIKYTDAKKFAMGMNKPVESEKERIHVNVRNVLDYVNASYQSERFGLGIVMHINKLFLDEIKDVWDIGKLINSKADMDKTFNFQDKEVYVKQSEINQFLKEIDEFLSDESIPELIRISHTIYHLLHSGIFAFGNDPTMLGIVIFLFKKAGFSSFSNYYKCIYNIEEKKKKSNEVFGVDIWCEMFFNELAKDLRDAKQRIMPYIEEVRIENGKYVDLNLRQIKGLSYLKQKGRISREIYSKLNNISQITSYRDLTNLLEKGYVHVEGIGKGTKYVI